MQDWVEGDRPTASVSTRGAAKGDPRVRRAAGTYSPSAAGGRDDEVRAQVARGTAAASWPRAGPTATPVAAGTVPSRCRRSSPVTKSPPRARAGTARAGEARLRGMSYVAAVLRGRAPNVWQASIHVRVHPGQPRRAHRPARDRPSAPPRPLHPGGHGHREPPRRAAPPRLNLERPDQHPGAASSSTRATARGAATRR